eukprot:SAG11_NODE_3040_length_2740_cov_15.737978_1_plen_175_part_10
MRWTATYRHPLFDVPVLVDCCVPEITAGPLDVLCQLRRAQNKVHMPSKNSPGVAKDAKATMPQEDSCGPTVTLQRSNLTPTSASVPHLMSSSGPQHGGSHALAWRQQQQHTPHSFYFYFCLFLCLLSCLSSSRLVSSRLVSSRLVSSRLVSSRLVSSRLVSSRLVSSRLVSSRLV